MNRKILLQQYILENSIDIACIQEAICDPGGHIEIPGYQHFILPSTYNEETRKWRRGLVTYVKLNIRVKTCDGIPLGENGETLTVSCHDTNGETIAKFQNVYIPTNALHIDPSQVDVEQQPIIIMGDLNAVTGDSYTRNCNGRRLTRYLQSIDNSLIDIGINGATHSKGNRLDYVLTNYPHGEPESCRASTLTSDHTGIYIELSFPRCGHVNRNITRSNRIMIPAKQAETIRETLNKWHEEYVPQTTDKYEEDIITHLKTAIGQKKQGYRTPISVAKRWYNSDPAVIRGKKQYIKLKKKYYNTPSPENQATLSRMENQLQGIMQKSRERHWVSMLETINDHTPQSIVHKKVAQVAGKTKKQPLHINPKGKAEELATKWEHASSSDSLPLQVRKAVRQRIKSKRHLVKKALKRAGICDNKPITEEEFERAKKKGKSTAPGCDGITYDVINFLASVNGNPILKLFNMIWLGGGIPKSWKKAIVVPIPKPGKPGEFRPISLTSCLSKHFERIILNRLNFIMGDKLGKDLYGFVEGKSTQFCLHRLLSGTNKGYTVFMDLQGAFDKANNEVIIGELAKHVKGRMLEIIQDYLQGRQSTVLFQGQQTRWRPVELGTPQGGVLSPTLFNILMSVIVGTQAKGLTKIVYADDVVLKIAKGSQVKRALEKITNACNSIGLVISTEKTKVMIGGNGHRLPVKIQGKRIEEVTSYKYMGVMVTKQGNITEEVERLRKICSGRIKLLSTIAHGQFGGSVNMLRRLYISTIRSLIDYRASFLAKLTKKQVEQLESIQLAAARAILGTPMCVNQHILRTELGLIPIEQRIREVAAGQLIRTLSTSREKKLRGRILRNEVTNTNRWEKGVRKIINNCDVDGYIRAVNEYNSQKVAPWRIPRVDISWPSNVGKKRETGTENLRQEFLERLEQQRKGIVVYSDGSLLADGRCGAGFCGFQHGKEVFGKSLRLTNSCSSTLAEVFGILAAIRMGKKWSKEITVVSDSSAALLSLKAKKTEFGTYIQRILQLVAELKESGGAVQFMWAPSHVGISGNDRADELANEGARREEIQYLAPTPTSTIKRRAGEEVAVENSRRRDQSTSETLRRYLVWHQSTAPPNYKGLQLDRRRQQVCLSRIRMGYIHMWELNVVHSKELNTRCRMCNEERQHRLHHYLAECPNISDIRTSCPNVLSYREYFTQPMVIKQVLARERGFAPSR